MNIISHNPQPSTLNLLITRIRIRGEYCEGYISIDGTRICSTLENNDYKVPSGEYIIRLVKCKHHARQMPVLLPQPSTLNSQPLCSMCPKALNSDPSSLNLTLPCYCPMLKPGNGVHNRHDGSILIGEYNCPNSLIHPKTVFEPLYERIRKSISRGNQVLLSVY